MVQNIDVSNLPSDVITKISSFLVGEPDYLRLKHNEALKKIQRKYQIEYLGPKRKKGRRQITYRFAVARKDIFFVKESVESIITNQEDRILDIIDDEIDEDDEDIMISLSVKAKACVRKSDKQYEENIFDCCDFLSPMFHTSEDDLLDDLFRMSEDIEDQILCEHERFHFDSFGISIFEFKMVFRW